MGTAARLGDPDLLGTLLNEFVRSLAPQRIDGDLRNRPRGHARVVDLVESCGHDRNRRVVGAALRLGAVRHDTILPDLAGPKRDDESVRVRREAKILKGKALASLRRAVQTFNGHDDDGRAGAVMRDLQHSFEMLLKAALTQQSVSVFDKRLGQAVGFEKCVNLARQHLGLTDDEAGTLRAIDALRDDEQHWFTHVAEGLLYAHSRAGVTLFDDLLQRAFDERLVSHLPLRVLPLSSEPPQDLQVLVDEEYSQISGSPAMSVGPDLVGSQVRQGRRGC